MLWHPQTLFWAPAHTYFLTGLWLQQLLGQLKTLSCETISSIIVRYSWTHMNKKLKGGTRVWILPIPRTGVITFWRKRDGLFTAASGTQGAQLQGEPLEVPNLFLDTSRFDSLNYQNKPLQCISQWDLQCTYRRQKKPLLPITNSEYIYNFIYLKKLRDSTHCTWRDRKIHSRWIVLQSGNSLRFPEQTSVAN